MDGSRADKLSTSAREGNTRCIPWAPVRGPSNRRERQRPGSAGLMFGLPMPRIDWSVLDWNRPAIDFYESIGARPMDGWTGYRLSGEALVALGSTGLPAE